MKSQICTRQVNPSNDKDVLKRRLYIISKHFNFDYIKKNDGNVICTKAQSAKQGAKL